jgi:lysozyme
MANFKYSAAGLALTKQFEGLELKAYQDSVGVWTIGYGHTGTDVKPGLTITEAQATVLLAADVAWAVTCVNKSVTSAINQNQFDAMVDFVFNLGCAAFAQSTLLRMVNAGDFAGAAGQFGRWNKAKGKVLAGLTKRRQGEMALFQKAATTAAAADAPAGVSVLRAAAAKVAADAVVVKDAVETKAAAVNTAAKKTAAKKGNGKK